MAVLDADFEFIRELVKKEAGIILSDEKQYLVKSRLAPLIAEHGLHTLRALVQHLRAKPNDPLRREIVDLMTTNESWFFRDHWPYECLRQFVLPEIASRKNQDRSLTIWSAACSSGQEPYSLAMTLRDSGESVGGWNTKIVATDISPTMLDRAKQGHFSQAEMSRGLSPAQKTKYFTASGNHWAIRDDLRNMIDFQPLNLTKPWPRLPQFDVVFLRNVLIYFDVATKEEVLRRVLSHLNPNGYLFLGSGETMVSLKTPLEPVSWNSNLIYRAPAARGFVAPIASSPAAVVSPLKMPNQLPTR